MRSALILLLFLFSLPAAAQQAGSAPQAELRVLDKLNGEVRDVLIRVSETAEVGPLTLDLSDCRYPASNPNGDAFAALTVHYGDEPEPVFAGWLIASAPALNAMDHPRYDIWALRCITS